MNPKYIFLNDKLVPFDEAKIHVTDLSIQRGYGIFDFLKTINYYPLFIDDYLNRLYHSAQEMELSLGFDRNELKQHIKSLIKANEIPNAGIKIILTGGYSADGYQIAEKSNFIMLLNPLKTNPEDYNKGMKLMSFNHQRQVPSVKTIDYIQSIKLIKELKKSRADDIIYHDNGQVRECPRANIFIVKDNKVYTPKSKILRGITRSKVCSLALKDIEIIEKDFSLNQLLEADEAFITSSTKNICPIVQIDGKVINNGEVGKITQELNKNLMLLIDNELKEGKD